MPSALRLVRRVCGIGGAVVFAFGLPRSVGAQLVPMPLAPMDTLVRHDPCVSQKIAKARFTIAPYGWLLGIHGDVGVRDLDAHVNISFSDLLSKLRWGAMGGFEFNYGHWLGTFDGVFASVHQENTPSVGGFNPDIDSRLDLAMTQAFVGYTFRARPNLAIDLLGGARLWRWDASLRLQGENITRQRERIRTFVDALGGVRVRGNRQRSGTSRSRATAAAVGRRRPPKAWGRSATTSHDTGMSSRAIATCTATTRTTTFRSRAISAGRCSAEPIVGSVITGA